MSSSKCKIITFKPRAEFDAHRQLREFIEHAKIKLNLFDTEPESKFDWNDFKWGTDGKQKKKGSNADSTINFTSLGSARWHFSTMTLPFADFAKAYIRYDLTFNWKKKADSHLTGLKLLEAALIRASADGIADVTKADASTLDVAATLIREYYKNEAQYQAAWRLTLIADFLTEYELVESGFSWRNPFNPPAGGSKVSLEKEAAVKLPDRSVLEALGTIFYLATEPRDILVVTMACILSAGPARTAEVVHCQNELEVWFDNADGSKSLGLEWYPAKDGEDGAKPLPKDFEPVVLTALEKVREITNEARKIALFYEEQGNHPTILYLPMEFESLREKEWLTNQEVFPLYGWKSSNDVAKMMTKWKIKSCKKRIEFPGRTRKDGTQSTTSRVIDVYSFADIEKHILSYLPDDFPWLDEGNSLKYSEALFIINKNFTNPIKGTHLCMFEACQYSTVHRKIGMVEKNNIFAKYSYAMPDGSPMILKTHQIRRWLNTIADRGGMSDWERDFWSGRKSNSDEDAVSRSSRAYVFNTVEDYLEHAGIKTRHIDQNPFKAVVASRPVSLDDFVAEDNKPLLHPTEFGICGHSFSMKPCGVHADCLNCMEHACIKGDNEKTERIRRVHELIKKQLEVAKEAVAEEYRTADQWFTSASLSYKRYSALLEILDDPSLPDDGSVIIMLNNPFQYSAFRNAVDNRVKKIGDASSIQIAKALEVPPLPMIEK